MGKLYSIISALLLTVSATFAAAPDGYEWWFDHDVSSVQKGSLSGSALDLEIDTSNLPKGIHYFNLRLAEGDSVYGPVFRKLFHAYGPDSDAISYEYWYDNDFDAKVTGSIDRGSNHLELDISNLPSGAHYYNIRLGYGDGSWGSVYRKMVINLAGNINAVAYEYWIDNNYSAKTYGELAPGSNSYEIDLKGVRRGLHRFNYRLKTGEGIWGVPFTSYFYSVSNAARFTEYEYWLDNDYANRVTGNATGNPTDFEVDLSAFDKSGGAHFFNLRTRDGDGDWSPIYHKLLVFNKTEKRQPIIGYRHYLDGDSLGYVEVERQFVDSYMFDVNLPDSLYPSVKNRKPSFDGDKVYIADTDSIDYTIHVRTEFGWAAPQKWKLGIGNDFSTTAVDMEINSKHTFAVPSELGFAAMKFTAPGDSVYFRSDVPVALDIYKDGERVAALTPVQVKDMAMLNLTEGEYFGVLYGVRDAEAKDFTLNLMDTPNIVPKPEISFEDGLVTMTCSRSDAEIRYTLDNAIPTVESTLYEGPFTLSYNATVRAIAYIPDSDIEPSEVAELIVDSYKTATPTGVFDLATRTMTLSCATAGAAISYRIGVDEDWTDYSAPFTIGHNCTVHAKACFEGYNDSDVAEIVVAEFPDSMQKPEITFAEGIVTISYERSDAEIRYTLDNTIPTVESALYEGPFTLSYNATVRAFAYIPDSDIEPSEVAELVVDYFKTTAPYGEFNVETRLLTIKCDTEGASIYYTFDLESEWIPYAGPFEIKENGIVYAKASYAGYNDSEISEITISDMICQPVSISYNGRYIHLATSEPDASILYTINGSAPTSGEVYSGDFDVRGLAKVRAVAIKPGYINSEVTDYDVELYADEEHAVTATAGRLEDAFEWSDSDLPNSIEKFAVEGVLNDADYKFLNSMEGLRHLDIEKVNDAHIPDYAFLNSKLISISLPSDLTEYGDSILSVASRLSSIVWNSRSQNLAGRLTDGLVNPNVLIYVPAEIRVENPRNLNIITSDNASSIMLHYGFPYFALNDFHADYVSLTYDFTQSTQVDVCCGWETIVLPFSPQNITHAVNGPIVPFAAWDGNSEGMKPFWLYSSTSGGWEMASKIEACVPYIISMPNNPDYVPSFNLAGKVTFSASNINIESESSMALATSWINGTMFEGTFMPVEESGLMSLNVNDTEGGLLPGSAFVPDAVTVPFGAYVRGASGRKAIPIFGEEDGVIVPIVSDGGLVVDTPSPGTIRVSCNRTCRTAIISPDGAIVTTISLEAGESIIVEGLTRGLYLVGRVKVMVR